jgi:hypothetical protein
MNVKDVVWDNGNEREKGLSVDCEVDFAHASARISTHKYNELVSQDDTSGIYLIDGVPYAIGDRANDFGSVRYEGAQRYTPEYYKRFLGVAFYQMFEKSTKNIFLYASLPPKDNAYKDTIKRIALGDVTVEHAGKEKKFSVKTVKTWYEPVGGAMNRLMDDKGYKIKDIGLNRGDTLVIDIGGLTTDYIILEGQKPDFGSARSFTERNIIDTIEDFTSAIISRYPRELSSARDLDARKIRAALIDGFYSAGAFGMLDVQKESNESCSMLVDAVIARYEQYGGALLDNVLLTGGGTKLLYHRIIERMKINNRWRHGVYGAVVPKSGQEMQKANVYGAKKLLAYYERKGVK